MSNTSSAFMKKLTVYFFIFLAIAVKSNGQGYFVLEGTVGRYPIVMMIEKSGATYFYKQYKHDIQLAGATEDRRNLFLQKLVFDSDLDKDTVAESFELKMISNTLFNQWEGFWRDDKGNRLPVSLKLIDTTKYNFSKIPDLQFENTVDRIYNKARLSGLDFGNDSTTISGQYKLHWFREPLTGINSFEIKSGYPAMVLKKINEVIKEKYFTQLQAYFTCTGRHGENGEYGSSIAGYFFSSKYISIESYSSWDCGGVHPDSNDDSFTIDARTGKEILDFDELFSFTVEKDFLGKDDDHDLYTERTQAIFSILKKLYPKQMSKPVSEDDCNYSELHCWQYTPWHFTAKGLYIGTSFPHAANACNNPEFSVIPFSVLKRYERKQ